MVTLYAGGKLEWHYRYEAEAHDIQVCELNTMAGFISHRNCSWVIYFPLEDLAYVGSGCIIKKKKKKKKKMGRK